MTGQKTFAGESIAKQDVAAVVAAATAKPVAQKAPPSPAAQKAPSPVTQTTQDRFTLNEME